MSSCSPTQTDSILVKCSTKNVTYASVVMKADSGASRHYIRPPDAKILRNITTVTNGPCVSLPDNTVMTGTQQGHLPIAQTSLLPEATQAHVFPHLSSASLLSLDQLCDNNCKIYLDKHSMKVYKNDKIVLTGQRNFTDGLWDVSLRSLPQQPTPSTPSTFHSNQSANVIIHKKQTTKQLAQYLHAACGSPPISTFLKAIKNGLLQSWPGIDLIKESDLTPTIATAKGHLDQERKNLQSTKQHQPAPASTADNSEHDESIAPLQTNQSLPSHASESSSLPQHGPAQKTQECYAAIDQFDRKAYSDLTGRYPHISSRGNQYILTVYDYDSSGILVQPKPPKSPTHGTSFIPGSNATATIHNYTC